MTNEEKMAYTLNIAKKALTTGELPIAATIFLGNEPLAAAYTSEKKDRRLLVHAELKALITVDKLCYPIRKRKEMQLFTTLEPCLMCLGAAMTFGIGEITYALDAPMDGAVESVSAYFRECGEIPYYTLPKTSGGMMAKQVKSLFATYVAGNKKSPMRDFAEALAKL